MCHSPGCRGIGMCLSPGCTFPSQRLNRALHRSRPVSCTRPDASLHIETGDQSHSLFCQSRPRAGQGFTGLGKISCEPGGSLQVTPHPKSHPSPALAQPHTQTPPLTPQSQKGLVERERERELVPRDDGRAGEPLERAREPLVNGRHKSPLSNLSPCRHVAQGRRDDPWGPCPPAT